MIDYVEGYEHEGVGERHFGSRNISSSSFSCSSRSIMGRLCVRELLRTDVIRVTGVEDGAVMATAAERGVCDELVSTQMAAEEESSAGNALLSRVKRGGRAVLEDLARGGTGIAGVTAGAGGEFSSTNLRRLFAPAT